MSKKPKSEVNYVCETHNLVMDTEAMREHLKSVHGIDASQTKCERQMVSHLDGRDWFSTTYRNVFPDGTVIMSSVVSKRAKDDMMRYV